MSADCQAIEALYPAGVVAAVAEPRDGRTSLFRAEFEQVRAAVPARISEFGRGRACARRAMAVLGLPPMPLLADADRAVCWPAGVTGSITHTPSYCAAVVGLSTRFGSLGLDAETIGGVTPDLWTDLFAESELYQPAMADDRAPAFATLLFSAKESAYKAQFPITRVFVEFREATVAVDWPGGVFLVTGPFGDIPGRFLVTPDVVVTSAWTEACHA